MPAGAAPAPWAVPARQIIGGGFPQDEIHRIALVGGNLDPGACDHVLDRAPRQGTVIRVAVHGKEDMALGLIGMTFFDQIRDHGNHCADIGGGAGHVIGFQGTQRAHIVKVPADRFLGDVPDAAARVGGTRVDLVIHIGEIAHLGDVTGSVDMAQQAVKHVEDHNGAGIAQMGAIIDGGAADIHPHIVGVQRGEHLFPAGLGVVQFDGRHRFLTRGCAAGLTTSTRVGNRRTRRRWVQAVMQQIRVMGIAFMGASYPLIHAATIAELTGHRRNWPRAPRPGKDGRPGGARRMASDRW